MISIIAQNVVRNPYAVDIKCYIAIVPRQKLETIIVVEDHCVYSELHSVKPGST